MKMEIQFRNLNNDEIDEAYRIVSERTEWLNSKKIRQWIAVLPKDILFQRQNKNENYGLFVDSSMAVFLSLVKEINEDWIDVVGNAEEYWLYTLCSAKAYSGNSYGVYAMNKVIEKMKDLKIKSLYLDCVSGNGFLENFYNNLGFATISKKEFSYQGVGIFDMVLMKHEI